MRKIEVDESTAAALELHAADEGLSVAQLLSRFVEAGRRTISIPPDEKAELKRRWEAIEAGEPTIPHDEVVRWLRTWGTPAFKPWSEP